MKLILDSDFISALSNPDSKDHQTAISVINNGPEDTEIYVSILTIYEIQFGRFADVDEERKARIVKTLYWIKESFFILNLGFEDSEIYGQLKYDFREKTGMKQDALKRHNIDIALASVSIANDCTIISRDKIYPNHLQKIDSRLQCEQW